MRNGILPTSNEANNEAKLPSFWQAVAIGVGIALVFWLTKKTPAKKEGG